MASWRMAMLLAGAGLASQADKAFAQALGFNLARLRFYGTRQTLLDVQIAGFNHRRMIVSAYATHILAGNPSEAEAQALVAAIAGSKGLASRYASKRRRLLSTLPDFRLMRVRPQVEALERRLRHLPVTGNSAVYAWAQWSNAYAGALGPGMEALEAGGLGEMFSNGQSILDEVRKHLGDAALIGFQVYQPVDFKSLEQQPSRYVRYTVNANGVTIQDIGDRRGLDRLVRAWRGDIDRPELPQVGRALADRLLGDLSADVASATEWVVDPDGLLALTPFEALPVGDGTVLDRHRVRYVSSLAGMVEQMAGGTQLPGNTRALIVADPMYAATEQMAAAVGTMALRSGSDERLRNIQLTPLPDTRQEAQAVAAALRRMGISATMRLGADATAEALHELDAPRFLHIASHGVFFTPEVDNTTDPRRYRVAIVLPGMLAGLVLAPGADGPMLWASDLAQLNLRGTELVVLSACDTGNGLVDVGEGLTSLRRAAEEAGARATVTSLWPVSSPQTTALMSEFYRALATGASKSAALRAAKLNARARGASVRDWAGFLLAGDDR